jgi:hypothetical protein
MAARLLSRRSLLQLTFFTLLERLGNARIRGTTLQSRCRPNTILRRPGAANPDKKHEAGSAASNPSTHREERAGGQPVSGSAKDQEDT